MTFIAFQHSVINDLFCFVVEIENKFFNLVYHRTVSIVKFFWVFQADFYRARNISPVLKILLFTYLNSPVGNGLDIALPKDYWRPGK